MGKEIFKSYAVGVKQVEGVARTLQFVASTESVDRDGEVLQVTGWQVENYIKNPVFLWAHRYDEPPIGKCVKCTASGDLVMDIEFADAETYPFADIVYRLYLGGFLNAVSVGFIPIEWETGGKKDGDPKKIFTKQELLELSAVPVPSNPEALQQARTAKVITLKEMKLVKKALESKSTAVEAPEPTKAAHSQAELADEMDYVKDLIVELGMSERTQLVAKDLAETIGRLTGCVKPDEIKIADKDIIKACKELVKVWCLHDKSHAGINKAIENMGKMFEDETPETPPEDDKGKTLISAILGK